MQTATEPRIRNLSIPLFLEDDETLSELPQTHKWTRAEFYQVAELGLFEGKRIELIEGEIIEMAAMKSPHATAVSLTRDVLQTIFVADFYIRVQMPIFVSDYSEPEPDLAVVTGKARDYKDEHPRTAVLIIEVADTTLYQDRNRKPKIYAQIGVEDYWILNLKRRQLEVRRRLKDGQYVEKIILSEQDSIAPLAKPDSQIAVADLLP